MISRALFVGIDRYRPRDCQVPNLGGCVGDMRLMHSTMTEVFGTSLQNVETLTDADATTSNLIAAIEGLVAGVRQGQVGFLYYAGHGGQVPNADRTADDPEDYDQILVPHDFSMTEPLLDDMLHAWLSRIPDGGKLVAILDSCHSGGMPRAPMSVEECRSRQDEGWQSRSIGVIPRAAYTPKQLQALGDLKKRFKVEGANESFVLLAAAQDDESAWERDFGDGKHGIFTYHVCEALRERGSAATPIELVDYAYAKIMGYRENQMPRLTGLEKFFRKPLFDVR